MSREELPGGIGRYEIVARLAMGGMAEILLARIHGPSGFERPVVVKRILPHLAQHGTFVDMFLDEARIAAQIQHPNVVQVHELGRDGGELYLVMEYLQGESVSSLLRRARTRGLLLEPALCAYVVSQACAGLHAAHEIRGPTGEPQNVVHRDISPHNILVTYVGGVKILDFGIAKAADRISQTEAGQLKGKFEYMSPEQCRGAALDRRSDIFSLGTVLYELLTGHRLFKRSGQLGVLRAVCDEPIPPPTELRDEIPPALNDVCMKALRRPREERYDTAADMRRDLLAAMRDLSHEPFDELAARWMHRLFPERIETKRDLLRLVQSGSIGLEIPAAEVDSATELPPVRDTDLDPEQPTRPLDRDMGGAARRWHRWAALAGGVAALAAAALAGALWWGEPESATAGSTADATLSRESSEGLPSANVPAELGPGEDSGRAQAQDAAAEPGDHAENEEPARQVRIHIASEPGGAAVRIAGEERGRTPLDVALPRADRPVEIVLHRRGYRTATERIVPNVDQRMRIALSRKPRRRPRTGGSGDETSRQSSTDNEGFRRFD